MPYSKFAYGFICGLSLFRTKLSITAFKDLLTTFKMQLVSIFAFVVLGSLLPATNSVKYNLKKCTTFNEVDNNVSNDGAYFSRLLIAGSHSFAINLLKALHKFEAGDSAGILFSPYSVWSALVVTLMVRRAIIKSYNSISKAH